VTGSPHTGFADYAETRIPSLRRLALLLCQHREAADDLVQVTLAKLCVHWARAAAAQNPDAYVRAILVREFVRERRTVWASRVSVTDQPPEVEPTRRTGRPSPSAEEQRAQTGRSRGAGNQTARYPSLDSVTGYRLGRRAA
jgi:DNA-directed RNA polymerase specialized sigma24 family protein